MKLKDYILTYKVDDKIVANLFDYYEVFIRNLDASFSSHSYYNEKLVLCFFKEHADINPSMGYIKDRHHKGGLLCHCLGCGRTADVVRLHQILSQQYLNIHYTEDEACRSLAELFNIPLGDFEEIDEEDYSAMFHRQERTVERLQGRYTSRDFTQGVLRIRKEGVDLNKINSECVKMIATLKDLYD